MKTSFAGILFRKSRVTLLCIILLPVVFCLRTTGQSYTVDWYKISGGGGTSTNGSYQITGTIDQSDASGAMSGGNYSVTGGFWALIQVVQTPGAPTLFISHSSNVVTIYWQNASAGTFIKMEISPHPSAVGPPAAVPI